MWRKLWFDDKYENAIRTILRKRLGRFDANRQLIVPAGEDMLFDTNWLFCGNTVASRDCYLWHSIMFEHFNLVPEYCKLHCYKVVVKVRNFAEAFQFFNLLNASAAIEANLCSIHGKCGIDSRHYTHGHFNGFVYCHGLEEALKKYKIIRRLVNEHLDDGENINVIVKRSCTEFEQQFGPTDNEFWNKITPEEADLERRLRDIFVGFWTAAVQPDWLKNKTFLTWAKWANSVGDTSWVDVFGKDFLTMSAVTYHPVDEKKSQLKE